MAKQNIAEVSQKVAIFLIYSTFLGERLQEKCLIWHKSPFLAQKQFKKTKDRLEYNYRSANIYL